ncbi:hypothetical protein [Sphingomonas melonis]
MATAACLPIAADRAGPCVRTIFFEGLDLTGVTLALEMRLNPETPGDAAVSLGMGNAANAEGLRLVGVTTANGVPTSQIVMRVNETTMKDAAKVPYTGELGSASPLYYDLIGTFGQDKRRLAYGQFTALPTVYGMDNAPANRPQSYGGQSSTGETWNSARLTFTADSAKVTIDGADLIGAEIVRAQAAGAQATDLASGLPLTYSSPNLWPDASLSTVGWAGPVVAGKSDDGRDTLTVTGADAKYRLPVSLIGSAGSIFSAGVDIERAAFAGGAPVAVLLRQLRSDTTLIVDTLLAIFVEGDATPTTSRVLARGAGMIVDTEAALLELYLLASGDPANSVTMSLPGLYRGASAAFRPVIARSPDSARVADYYVDARPGTTAASDTNAGVSPDAPFRSVTAALGALAATGNLPNRTIAIRRGSVLRGQTIESPAAGLSVVAYGEGSAPRSLGSMAYSRSRLMDAGGGVFTLPLGYKPSTCALVEITTGNVTKLFNPDSNDVPPATGNWGWASDTLHIKPGFDPAGYMLEVPRNDGAGYGFHAAAERQTVSDIMFEHWRDHGASTNHPDTRWIDTWCNWNGFDGFDQDAGAERFLIRGAAPSATAGGTAPTSDRATDPRHIFAQTASSRGRRSNGTRRQVWGTFTTPTLRFGSATSMTITSTCRSTPITVAAMTAARCSRATPGTTTSTSIRFAVRSSPSTLPRRRCRPASIT